MIEIFDKMSLKFRNLDGKNRIWLGFSGKTKKNSSLPSQLKVTFSRKNYQFIEHTGEPLETIVISNINTLINQINARQCMTFFSYVQKEWINFQLQFD